MSSSPSSSSAPTTQQQLAATHPRPLHYNNPAQTARSQNLYHTTPLLHSLPLSRLCHPHPVYLKLDLLQPSGSFKDRGMAHLVCTVRDIYAYNNNDNHHHDNNNNDNHRVQFISSSGGNAGLALTTVCRSLRPPLPVSVIVPETTKAMVVRKLETLGADVTVFGKNWNEADALARRRVEDGKEKGGTVYYVSPYDNPLLWTGHSTVVDEMIDQLSSLFSSSSSSSGDNSDSDANGNIRIGAILASVGGGGLLSGILEGLERNYYHHHHDNGRSDIIRGTKVVACETEGAASFAASFHANSIDFENNSSNSDGYDDNANEEPSLNMKRLEGITSVATSLGALEVTPAVIHRAHRHQRRGRRCDDASSGGDAGNGMENGKIEATGSGAEEDVLSYTCTDAEAIDACVRFATDHRMLVEPACGAALAPIYSERLRERLLGELNGDGESCAIVVEVCGGSGVSAELLMEWKKQFLE